MCVCVCVCVCVLLICCSEAVWSKKVKTPVCKPQMSKNYLSPKIKPQTRQELSLPSIGDLHLVGTVDLQTCVPRTYLPIFLLTVFPCLAPWYLCFPETFSVFELTEMVSKSVQAPEVYQSISVAHLLIIFQLLYSVNKPSPFPLGSFPFFFFFFFLFFFLLCVCVSVTRVPL